MKKITLANKGGVYIKLLKKLYEREKKCSKNYIPFPDVFQVLCSPLILTKQDAWEMLSILSDLSIVKPVSCHGIKLNYQMDNLEI